jgi:hypothetical protein
MIYIICPRDTKLELENLMAENDGLDVNKKSHPWISDINKMTCDIQQSLADL